MRRVATLGLPKMQRQAARGLGGLPAMRTHAEAGGGGSGPGSTWSRPLSLALPGSRAASGPGANTGGERTLHARGGVAGPTYGYGGGGAGGRLATIVDAASSPGGGVGGIGAVVPKLAPLMLRRQLGTHGEGGDGLDDNLSKIDVLDLAHDESVRHHLFSAYGNGRIVGWDVEYGTVRCNWSPSKRRGGVRCVACDGELVYCGFSDGYLRVYDQRQWRCVKAVRKPPLLRCHSDARNDEFTKTVTGSGQT